MTVVLNQDKVADLIARAQREVDEGQLPGCQVVLAIDGEVVVNEALGDDTPETRHVIFSCTKPLVASAIWLLMGEGKVDIASKVVEHIPEFGTNGKDVITIEQLLLHTAGFPYAPLGPPEWWTREGRVAAFARWHLNWEPGTACEYHATSAHWVLAEIIDRVTGGDYRDFVRTRVCEPLGLPRLQLGAPLDDQGDIAPMVVRGEEREVEGMSEVMANVARAGVTNEALVSFNMPEVVALGVPGGGAVARASDLALFYQALLRNPGELWDPKILADAESNVRNHLRDRLLTSIANRTIGLIVAGDDGQASLRGLPRTASPRTFGHNGAGGQIAWADPDTGFSFCFLTNGIDADVLRQYRRGAALSNRAGACVESDGV